MPDACTILDLFADSVARNCKKVAVRFEEAQLTYGELNRKSNALAQHLKERGTKKGDLIPVIVGNSLELAISWLAVMKAGAVIVPVSRTRTTRQRCRCAMCRTPGRPRR